jgi:hypothetical protein
MPEQLDAAGRLAGRPEVNERDAADTRCGTKNFDGGHMEGVMADESTKKEEKNRRPHARTAANCAIIADVRARSGLLVLDLYCDHGACPARQSRIFLKDHDRSLLSFVGTRGLPCSLCGHTLKCHGARTFAEQVRNEDRNARLRVKSQRYARDHAIPLSAFHDDRFPEEL